MIPIRDESVAIQRGKAETVPAYYQPDPAGFSCLLNCKLRRYQRYARLTITRRYGFRTCPRGRDCCLDRDDARATSAAQVAGRGAFTNASLPTSLKNCDARFR